MELEHLVKSGYNFIDDPNLLIDDKESRRLIRSRKRENAKALKLLGVDPSKDKIEESLGIDSDYVAIALCESQRKRYGEETIDTTSVNRKTCRKALALLGYDHSLHKIMNTFGFKEEEEALKAVKESSPNTLLYVPTFEPKINKKDDKKAWKVLGFDPSIFKVLRVLGIHSALLKHKSDELVAEQIMCIM